MTTTTTPSLPVLRVTEMGEYIRHSSCERRFRLEMNQRRLARSLPFAERLFNALDPVLQAAGRERETGWEAALLAGGLRDLSGYSTRPDEAKHTPWADLVAELGTLAQGDEAYGREVEVSATVGAFEIEGRVDFVLLLWRDGRPVLRLVECKASRRDRTYHRIQVAIYQAMVRTLLISSPVVIAGHQLSPDDVECVVARIDEATNESQEILALDPLDLEMEVADVDRLLADDGALRRIATSNLEDLPYQLEAKCDGCVFNVHCLSESGRMRRVELLGVSPSVVRTFATEGIDTLDDLSALDPTSDAAKRIREREGFGERVDELVRKAAARRRTLPVGDTQPDSYEVEGLPGSGHGQLPPHEFDGHRLIRVYLAVDYDYSENRVGALSAHVTASDWGLHTTFVQDADGKWKPDPTVVERGPRDEAGAHPTRALRGREVIHFASSEWTGRYETDTGVERGLIQGFFHELVDAIAAVAQAAEAPVHFYVWSRSEMARLVEACSRVDSRLLSHLRQLLGCRESLEQLLYSCLQEEVDRRFALGWSGRGLAVVSSLRWFGRRYHWTRTVSGQERSLDRDFAQDIFDFKTDLQLKADGTWGTSEADTATRHKFEIRSRFHDSLTAPYWRAYWRTLPSPDDPALTPQVANAIRRYNHAAAPGLLREYLRARTHALRWLEEGVRFKNEEIEKPLLTIADLPSFDLGVDNASHASIDFLRLDQHVNATDWLAKHLVPPINRVPTGRTLPVSEVYSHGNNELTATINLDGFDMDLDALQARCSFGEGSFVRLSPCSEDPSRGQTFGQLMRGGKTCRITSINWATGQVELGALWTRAGRYTLLSTGAQDEEEVFDFATIDENVSDYVAGKVEARLQAAVGHHALRWFDPLAPAIPASAAPANAPNLTAIVDTFPVAPGRLLAEDQATAASSGLATRVQLLQGPPGTGKTTTTSAASLLRILARRQPGDCIIVAAHTHTAVDTLLERLDEMLDEFSTHARSRGLNMPPVALTKVHSSQVSEQSNGRIQDFTSKPSVRFVKQARRNAVLVVGGTTGAVLKLAAELSQRRPWRDDALGFQVSTLIVDEASMMVFPHFLSLATLVHANGEIMLTGDHRQLAPIVSHDWEKEDRPPTIVYQPFASAYQAVESIARNDAVPNGSALRSALSFTFRLPPIIRDLIARIYRLDDIDLDGLPRAGVATVNGSGVEAVWSGQTGLYLVLHDERSSRQSNRLEVDLIEQILAAAPHLPDRSTALMTPHRAQRSLLKVRLGAFGNPVDVIDTVERMQGGERPTVIFSATVSDPAAIASNVEFILDLNRSNVAFSRAQDRLIVVCSRSLLDHVPAELEHYESALLWKSLRALCTQELGRFVVDGHTVRVLTPPIGISTGSYHGG
ncbi:MAG: AAA domain-containing protein [Myxococcota bacterium]